MHIILEPDLFLERVDKLFALLRNLKGKKLRISTTNYGRAFFQCDQQSLEIPAKIITAGEVLIEAGNAKKVLSMYSGIDSLELFTKDNVLIIKQRNFTMNLPCINDEDVTNFADALSTDRVVMLKLEKRRLQAEIKLIDQEIASRVGGVKIFQKRK